MRARLASLLILLLAPRLEAAQGGSRLGGLRTQLAQRIAQSGADAVAVYARDLTTGDSILIEADARFHAASTMKLGVLVQVMRDVDAGRLSLSDRLDVRNGFRSIADGSVYELSPSDDSDSSLYRRTGRQASVRELVELMITVSSNLATNILIDLVRPERVRATLARLGADSLVVLRGVEDGPAYRAGLNNTTTARGLGVLLAAIVNGEAASPASCGAMMDILMRQRFNEQIPAGLPRRTRVAHKTGDVPAVVSHDAAVVYSRGRPHYVLVVLTRGLSKKTDADSLIADLARVIHAELTGSD